MTLEEARKMAEQMIEARDGLFKGSVTGKKFESLAIADTKPLAEYLIRVMDALELCKFQRNIEAKLSNGNRADEKVYALIGAYNAEIQDILEGKEKP